MVAVVALAVLSAAAVALSKADEFISDRLASVVTKAGKGRFKLEYEGPAISFLERSVTFSQVHFFSPDRTFIAVGDSLCVNPDLRASRVSLSGIGLLSLLLRKEIKLAHIAVEKPEIRLVVASPDEMQAPAISLELSREEERTGGTFKVGSIKIDSGQLEWRDLERALWETGFGISAEELHIDADREFPLEAASLALRLTGPVKYPGDDLKVISADSLLYQYPSGQVAAFGVKVYSSVGKYELGRIKQHQADWVSFQLRELSFSAKYPALLLARQRLQLSSMLLSGLQGKVFKDKRWPFPDRPDRPMPYEMLSGLPVTVVIDSVVMEDSEIVYEEYAEKATETGYVSFQNLHAVMAPLHSDSAVVATLTASAAVMGEGLLRARFEIPLTKDAGRHKTSGTMGPMDMQSLNPILKHSAGVSAEAGRIDGLEFSFTYDELSSEGEARFAYSGLRVQLLDRQGDGPVSRLEEQLGSWVVNSFITKTDNKPGETFRTGKIAADRNPKKSIFNYWWESLFSGLRSSITPGEKKD